MDRRLGAGEAGYKSEEEENKAETMHTLYINPY
jgi:hypothetical protein